MAARKIKSFGNKAAKAKEPILFEIFDNTFEAYPQIPGAVLMDFIGSADDSSSANAKSIMEYLKASMKPSEFERFDVALRDPENIVEISDISEIVSYLIEEQASRPTTAS